MGEHCLHTRNVTGTPSSDRDPVSAGPTPPGGEETAGPRRWVPGPGSPSCELRTPPQTQGERQSPPSFNYTALLTKGLHHVPGEEKPEEVL